MKSLRTAVLISGRGSNLRSLIQATQTPDYPVEIVLAIANCDAPGLEYAREAGITTMKLYLHKKQVFNEILESILRSNRVDLVILAGFMRILDAGLVTRWTGRIINVHPSLLPDYPGLHPQQRAIDAGASFSGCTVHYVTPEVDAGPIIAQAVVDVLENDTEASLSDRILQVEHVLYPIAAEQVARKILNEQNDRDTSG